MLGRRDHTVPAPRHKSVDRGLLTPLFRPLRTVFRGRGADFLNLGGKTENAGEIRGENGKKWARNGLRRVGRTAAAAWRSIAPPDQRAARPRPVQNIPQICPNMVKIPKFQSKFRTVRSAWPAHSRTNAPMIDFHSKMDERKPISN